MTERILLGFLGTGDYKTIRYQLDGKTTPPTPFSIAALSTLMPEHRPVLLTTREALEENWHSIEEAFQKLGRAIPERVEIPSGKSEEEIWAVVERAVTLVPEGASVVLDITHGFRTQPLLVFSALRLLSNWGRASVERILYGAYEARSLSGETPFFDLSPLLELNDWSQALGDLKRYGYASPVRELLREASKRAHIERRKHRPTSLVQLGDVVERLTRALAVLRPKEAHQEARRIPERLRQATRDLEAMPELRPVAPFLKEALERYQKLGEAESPFSWEGLPELARMIRLYLDLEQYPQAITLSREALVTRRTLEHCLDPLDLKARQAAEGEINSAAKVLQLGGQLASSSILRYAELWNELADLRNDVDHAGFRSKPRSAESVRRQAQAVCARIADWLEAAATT